MKIGDKNENQWKEFPKALDELSKIKTLKALDDMFADAKKEDVERRNREFYEKHRKEVESNYSDKLNSINNSSVFALLELGSK